LARAKSEVLLRDCKDLFQPNRLKSKNIESMN